MVFPSNELTSLQLREEEGFPEDQTKAFATVARTLQVVILTRTPGAACAGLLDEGYDAKSFHIKAKSCDWGAAAGFLCVDPLLNKSGARGAATNAKENWKSFNNVYSLHPHDKPTAWYTPVVISETRLKWLKEKGKVICEPAGPDGAILTRAITNAGFPGGGTPQLPADAAALFRFVPVGKDSFELYYKIGALYSCETVDRGTLSEKMLQVFNKSSDNDYKNAANYIAGIMLDPDPPLVPAVPKMDRVAGYKSSKIDETGHKRRQELRAGGWFPVLAMVNPDPPYPDSGNQPGPLNARRHLNAVTGDYDLFAIWARDISEDDRRVGPMAADTTDNQIFAAEASTPLGKVAGNVSNRIMTVAAHLNSLMTTPQGTDTTQAHRVNRVFHSDEAGRPGVMEVDKAVAFDTDGKAYSVRNAAELGEAINYYHGQHFKLIPINRGWINLEGENYRNRLAKDFNSKVTWTTQINEVIDRMRPPDWIYVFSAHPSAPIAAKAMVAAAEQVYGNRWCFKVLPLEAEKETIEITMKNRTMGGQCILALQLALPPAIDKVAFLKGSELPFVFLYESRSQAIEDFFDPKTFPVLPPLRGRTTFLADQAVFEQMFRARL